MPDIEIAEAFGERVRKNIVRIEVEPLDFGEGPWTGTGVVFACVSNANHGRMPFIITAGHVIRIPDGRHATYRVTRAGEERRRDRRAAFEFANVANVAGSGPRAFWHKDDTVDLGGVIGSATCADGTPFFTPDEWSADGSLLAGLPMMPRVLLLGEGTRVAWAGYPESASDFLGEPALCYYEGVVAYVKNDAKMPLYLVDGHNDRGVSGGPLWWWNEKSKQVQVAGIISSYSQAQGHAVSLPGLVCAIAVNPFVTVFEEVWLPTARRGGSPS